ncbi:ABC transporter permease [bacterium]|nr:ABC transporter permease [bacterium]
MIKNYFKTAWRKLSRNKNYTLINMAGLSIGMTCALCIYLIIQHELSYDAFHKNKDRIYRVNTVWYRDGEVGRNGASQFPLGAAIRSHFSDVKTTTVYYVSSGVFTIPDGSNAPKKFAESEGVAYVEPEFFEIFDAQWIEGHPSSLAEPYSVVLSQSMAKKFFGNENPLGKTFNVNNLDNLTVVGLMADPRLNTNFPFTVFISYSTQRAAGRNRNLEQWGATMSSINTYVLAPENWDAMDFNARVTDMAKPFLDERRRHERGYEVQPLSDIHFNPETDSYTHTTTRSSMWALSIIGLFLVATACINFVNLATAQAITRAKEVGVRKVLGAFRTQLLVQFFGETFLITILSGVIAMGLTELAVPLLNSSFDFHLQFSLIGHGHIWLFLACLIALISIGSGFYPAIILAGYQPATVLKGGQSSSSTGGLWIRKGLVVFQFMIAQALIIGTIVVFEQMELFRKTDMGFVKDAIVITDVPVKDKSRMESLRTELMRQPGIQNVTFGFEAAASTSHWTSLMVYKDSPSGPVEMISDMRIADENYISTYGLKLLAGRNYTMSDTIHELVINEAAVAKMGLTNPMDAVGKTLYVYGEDPRPIVGVVKNFNMTSLHSAIEPMVMSPQVRSYNIMSVKITMENSKELLGKIESAWSKAFPEFVYDYSFLDETIQQFYEDEQRTSRLFTIFASIAIFIGCLGLFGLVSFMAAQRTKEIGVRKVLGAGIGDILMIFGKDFAQLITIAFVIAAPIAYFTMSGWLQDFAYRITIGPGVFVSAMVFALVIAAVTVGYRAIRAASANPVDALKYE